MSEDITDQTPISEPNPIKPIDRSKSLYFKPHLKHGSRTPGSANKHKQGSHKATLQSNKLNFLFNQYTTNLTKKYPQISFPKPIPSSTRPQNLPFKVNSDNKHHSNTYYSSLYPTSTPNTLINQATSMICSSQTQPSSSYLNTPILLSYSLNIQRSCINNIISIPFNTPYLSLLSHVVSYLSHSPIQDYIASYMGIKRLVKHISDDINTEQTSIATPIDTISSYILSRDGCGTLSIMNGSETYTYQSMITSLLFHVITSQLFISSSSSLSSSLSSSSLLSSSPSPVSQSPPYFAWCIDCTSSLSHDISTLHDQYNPIRLIYNELLPNIINIYNSYQNNTTANSPTPVPSSTSSSIDPVIITSDDNITNKYTISNNNDSISLYNIMKHIQLASPISIQQLLLLLENIIKYVKEYYITAQSSSLLLPSSPSSLPLPSASASSSSTTNNHIPNSSVSDSPQPSKGMPPSGYALPLTPTLYIHGIETLFKHSTRFDNSILTNYIPSSNDINTNTTTILPLHTSLSSLQYNIDIYYNKFILLLLQLKYLGIHIILTLQYNNNNVNNNNIISYIQYILDNDQYNITLLPPQLHSINNHSIDNILYNIKYSICNSLLSRYNTSDMLSKTTKRYSPAPPTTHANCTLSSLHYTLKRYIDDSIYNTSQIWHIEYQHSPLLFQALYNVLINTSNTSHVIIPPGTQISQLIVIISTHISPHSTTPVTDIDNITTKITLGYIPQYMIQYIPLYTLYE